MRRRKLTDDERRAASFDERQPALFTNESKPSWPVVHPEVLPLVQPTSDETKGPLSAAEAERVIRGLSIRFAGHVFESDLVHCAACADWRVVPEGHGCRRTIYSGTAKDTRIGACFKCGEWVVGEDPRPAA